MIRTVRKLTAPLERRLRLLVTRGLLKLVDDAPGIQAVQITGLHGEVLDGVQRLQQYGLTSHPHPDADCLVLNVGASRAHPVVVAVDDRRYRLHLQPGEVALYDDLGQSVTLTRAGVVIEAPQGLTVHGNVTVSGALDASVDVTTGGISLKSHTHPGVQPGGSSTGAPQ